MAFTIGENVGPYRIISQLGQGGMATVYKAYHASLDRYVAIKVLHTAFKEDPTFTARFAREARVLAKLEHTNIVPIYDFAEHNGDPYLVMKYVEGDTLKARMSAPRGALPMDEVLKVVDAVGGGLSYAHKQGILHRDIKPSNVIITHDNQYFLSDFGLARIASAGESTLSQDTMLGTPNYISPEQAKGVRDLDARTDIYSFGVLLYEMVVGRVPFSGDTPFAIIHDHIYTPLPLPSKVNPNVSEEVERVLLKALAKDREDRFADASLLVSAFHQAMPQPASASMVMNTAAAAVGVAATAPVTSDAAATAASTVQAAKPADQKPKSKTWMWVAAGVGALVVLAIIGLIAFNAIRNFNQNSNRQTQAARSGTNVALGTPQPQPQGGTPRPPQGGALVGTAPFLPTAMTAVAANPNNTDAHIRLAQAYFESGRPGEAVDEYSKAAELARGDVGAKIIMDGARFMGQRDPIAALSLLANGLERNPNNREMQELVGLYLNAVIQRDDAEPILTDFVHRFDKSAVPRYALAMHYIFRHQNEKVKPLVDEMVAKFPNDPYTYFTAGMNFMINNQRDQALREFEKVTSDRNAPELLSRRAQDQINILKGTPIQQPGTPRP